MNHLPDTLVTGATGFIGRWLIATLTSEGRHVAALLRGAEGRAAEFVPQLVELGADPRFLTLVEGDVERDGMGLSSEDRERLANVRDVFHLAGRMRFGMPRREARSIHLGGTEHVLHFAANRPRLRRVVYVGGYRAEHAPDWLQEARYPLPRRLRRRLYRSFGAYEASKLEAHIAARALRDRLGITLTIVNPAAVIGDSRSGETIQLEGLADTIERLWEGKLPALVGTPDTFLPVIAVDDLARLLAAIPADAGSEGKEIAAIHPDSPNLRELVALMARHLGAEVPARTVSKRIVKLVPRQISGVEPEALSFVSDDRYDLRETDSFSERVGFEFSNLEASTERYLDFLVSTRFLRSSSAERGRLVPAGGARTFALGPSDSASVWLHGLPWNADSWTPLRKALGNPVVLRPDLPGLGRSREVEDDVEWLAQLLRSEEPVTVVGHSWGTSLAVRFADAYPARVRRLVLIAPFFLQQRGPWLHRREALVSRGLRALGKKGLAKQAGGLAHEHELLASAASDLGRRGVARRAAHILRVAGDEDLRERLRCTLERLPVNVDVIVGSDDPLGLFRTRARVREIAGAGHAPHLSHPAQVAAAFSSSVRRHLVYGSDRDRNSTYLSRLATAGGAPLSV